MDHFFDSPRPHEDEVGIERHLCSRVSNAFGIWGDRPFGAD